MILNKIPPYRAVGGQECPPYNIYICYMFKIGFAKVSGSLKKVTHIQNIIIKII
ncbi:MAG: hypothetical protein IKI11_07290 [Neisseriaceae bacterium]|nr:hypothetical protein [Neisseriaceae bacterium]